MARAVESDVWHRVRLLRPRLRAHVDIHRNGFRDQVWYVLEDRAAGRYFRFSPEAWQVICRFDGQTTIEEVLADIDESSDFGKFDQGDMVQLLTQLHRANALHGDVAPDLDEMVNRIETMQQKRRILSLLNPLALRVPMVNPEQFVAATYPLVRPIISWAGLLLFVALTGYAILQAASHWDALTSNLMDRLLTLESLALLLLTYPFVKLLHELGHAYAIKRWGGEVPELGVMFLVFMPVPYVDASSASAFPSKWARAFVGAAGMIVEITLASIALLLWLEAEPGLFRAFLFNVMLIGGVSTLIFNGNPLLRFDGYYILCDLVEIPNLGQRANRYYRHIILRHLFGVETSKTPVTAPGEAAWFAAYAPAAFVYRLFIMVAILTFVSQYAFVLGVALAFWIVGLVYVFPLLRMLKFLISSRELRGHRTRALTVTSAIAAMIAAPFFFVPVPYATVSEGVIEAPGAARIINEAEGFVAETLVAQGTEVAPGEAIITLSDPLLDERLAALGAEIRELQVRLRAAEAEDRAGALIIAERLKHANAEAALFQQRRDALTVTAGAGGQVALRDHSDLVGRFLNKGETLGHVINPSDLTVSVPVRQGTIDLVAARTTAVSIWPASGVRSVIPGRISAQTPSAQYRVPNPALTTLGGGHALVDPSDASNGTTLEQYFLLEISPSRNLSDHLIGQRVHVRFDLGTETLAAQSWRALRQTFLTRFGV